MLSSRQYNTDMERTTFQPRPILKEVIVMKKIFAAIRELLEQYYASFAFAVTCTR